jgi:selenide,water dikinase
MFRQGFRTRASQSNREFLQPLMRLEPTVDQLQMELAFDPQTSGGLLISVPPPQVDELVRLAREQGAPATSIIGEVVEHQDSILVLR